VRIASLLGLLVLASCVEDARPPVLALADSQPAPVVDEAYTRVVERVAAMVRDGDLSARVSRRGLHLVNVAWEDTGRAEGSAIGPNISDFTLQVRHAVAARSAVAPWFQDDAPPPLTRWETTLMPVIRPPNFTDVTGDVPASLFFVRVGNASGKELRTVPLLDVIRDLGRFATASASLGEGSRVDLSAPRDTHFLVSAQALFLPIPRREAAEFNPVLFNYQSAPSSPAVLAILATREGTSMTVIENRPSDQGLHWGQELYFNAAGTRAYYTAERRTDVVARIAAQGGPRTEADRSMLSRGADVMAMIQIPLVHDDRGVLPGLPSGGGDGYGYSFSDDPLSAGGFGPSDATIRVRQTDLERAVLGHGVAQGPFREGYGSKLVRDARFPIRITIQFYKATATGDASDSDLDAIRTSISSVYAHADYVGSLVVPMGDTARPTAWQHVPDEWFPW
jgi:hypothetical protein